jgi:hypothetical protein
LNDDSRAARFHGAGIPLVNMHVEPGSMERNASAQATNRSASNKDS